MKKSSFLSFGQSSKDESKSDGQVPEEAFLMVAQVTWEDDIIWDDSEETKQKVSSSYVIVKNDAFGVLIECEMISGYAEHQL